MSKINWYPENESGMRKFNNLIDIGASKEILKWITGVDSDAFVDHQKFFIEMMHLRDEDKGQNYNYVDGNLL